MTLGAGLATRALRLLPPEAAHNATLLALKAGMGPRLSGQKHHGLKVQVAGLNFPNPLGLAAGFDKNAEVPDAMLAAGFGFVECGTVTPLPQAGNPKPRLFRLTDDKAVINRLGFNNHGLETFASNLADRRAPEGIVGANIGANKDSADRIGDYVTGFRQLYGRSSYITVNISSPNTPGLRGLQESGPLTELLGRLVEERLGLQPHRGFHPIFLKVAPDIDDAAVSSIVDVVRTSALDGLIVSNTTIQRPDGLTSRHRTEAGGLSGRPLMDISTQVLKEFSVAFGPDFPLIGVGGVASGADAWRKIRAGASLVQLYTALVFSGPTLIESVLKDLAARLKAEGFTSVSDAVGTG